MPNYTSEPRFGAIKGNHVALIRAMQAEALMQPDDLKLNAVVRVIAVGLFPAVWTFSQCEQQ